MDSSERMCGKRATIRHHFLLAWVKEMHEERKKNPAKVELALSILTANCELQVHQLEIGSKEMNTKSLCF